RLLCCRPSRTTTTTTAAVLPARYMERWERSTTTRTTTMRASSSGICGMRNNRSHTIDELLSSRSRDQFGAKDDFATTSPPRRRRSLPSCVRLRQATAATAGCVNTVL
ncbi:unnamed protein product, partial [Ectocarpus sp. 12 AP-2014]